MCDCIKKMNEQLKDRNGYIHSAAWTGTTTGKVRTTVKIPVGKLDSKARKSPPPVIPNFCPFCGEWYNKAPTP